MGNDEELRYRWRRIRAIVDTHLICARDYISPRISGDAARRLGLSETIAIAQLPDVQALLSEIALFWSEGSESCRPIDLYTQAHNLEEDSDEALTLAALSRSRFFLFRIRERQTVRLIADNIVRPEVLWLLENDTNIEGDSNTGVRDGMVLGGRLMQLDSYHMTIGGVVPVTGGTLKDVLTLKLDFPYTDILRVLDEPRFPGLLYSASLQRLVASSMLSAWNYKCIL
jgi:hypothetical protein